MSNTHYAIFKTQDSTPKSLVRKYQALHFSRGGETFKLKTMILRCGELGVEPTILVVFTNRKLYNFCANIHTICILLFENS